MTASCRIDPSHGIANGALLVRHHASRVMYTSGSTGDNVR